ncbi:hypothetical protein [Streptomyces sp. NPDC008121]|uniref:fascin domain-containing protein n=1 Tax=Streptomyces sp. NPDC008121 TaxID=3364809 RepID=UPI0036E37110
MRSDSGLVSTPAGLLDGYLGVQGKSTAGTAETFTIAPLSGDGIALKSKLTGKSVRVDTALTGPADPAMPCAQMPAGAGAAEKSTLEQTGQGDMRLKSGITGKYVVRDGLIAADGNTDQALRLTLRRPAAPQ